MKALLSQVRAELTLFLRDQTGVFFTVLLPFLMVVFFGYLNRDGRSGEVSYASFLLAGGIGLVVTGAAFEVQGPALARQRDDGVLKRLGGTPLRAWTLMGAKVLTAGVVILAQSLVMLLLNVFLFGAEIHGSVFWSGLALLIGVVTFVSMGFALAGLSPSADVAAAAAHAIAIPMQFLCETLFPVETMPALLRRIAQVLPMTYFVRALRGAMLTGGGPQAYPVEWAVLAGCLVVSFVLAVVTFRWE
jgi:ABC-2 type transport system permease protein